MKKKTFLVSAFVLIAVFMTIAMATAAPPQGLLVDRNGTPVKGYSNVYIENGRAYPVYNSSTNLWYTVFVIGTDSDGVTLCTLGHQMGIDSSESIWDDNGAPPAAPAHALGAAVGTAAP